MKSTLLPSEAYRNLLTELEEAIILWQKEQKEVRNDRQFNGRKHLANVLCYKDQNYIYKVMDIYDNGKAKLGLKDLEIILNEIDDLTPLENYLEALNKK